MASTLVIVARIPERLDLSCVYPPERYDEIMRCSNERVRREKLFAWRLLEDAVTQCFGVEFDKIRFDKLDGGKWVCDVCHFSISHSRGVAAVAVSDVGVGIDVEEIRKRADGIEHRILTDAERACFAMGDLTDDQQVEYIIEKWTQKEALFKRGGEGTFVPSRIETDSEVLKTCRFELDGRIFAVSLACERADGATVLHRFDAYDRVGNFITKKM